MVDPPILMMDRPCDDRPTPQVADRPSALALSCEKLPEAASHRPSVVAHRKGGRPMDHLEVGEELERTVGLRSGVRVRLRPIRSDHAPRLVSLYGRRSRDTAYRRAFRRASTPPRLTSR